MVTFWAQSHRFDPRSAAIADRHYNRRKVGSPQFAPPGRCLIYRHDDDALWITSWPYADYVRHDWAGAWVNSCFRNESDRLSSELIREAIAHTRSRWVPPPLGIVTFVDPTKVRHKRDPGRCYMRAGFRRAWHDQGWAYRPATATREYAGSGCHKRLPPVGPSSATGTRSARGVGMVTFRVEGKPVAQGSLTSFRHRSTGKVVTPQKASVVEYRDRVAWAARQTGMACTDEPVQVRAVFGFARPKSHRLASGKLTKKAPTVHAGRPDVDKLCRALLDAISGGVLLYDDAQVVLLVGRKQWHDIDETWVEVSPFGRSSR